MKIYPFTTGPARPSRSSRAPRCDCLCVNLLKCMVIKRCLQTYHFGSPHRVTWAMDRNTSFSKLRFNPIPWPKRGCYSFTKVSKYQFSCARVDMTEDMSLSRILNSICGQNRIGLEPKLGNTIRNVIPKWASKIKQSPCHHGFQDSKSG